MTDDGMNKVLAALTEKVRAKASESEAKLLGAIEHADMTGLLSDLAAAIGGDERIAIHLRAELSQATFSAEARAWIDLDEWRELIVGSLLEIAEEATSMAIRASARMFAELLKGFAGAV